MDNKILVGNTNSILIQLFRYFFVGGLAFFVDYGSLYLLTEFAHIDYLVSAVFGFLLGLAVNYIICVLWVFSNSRLKNKLAEFTIFSTVGLVGLILNELILFICCEIFYIHYMVSKLFSTGIVFFWNFFARKIILFTKTKDITGI